MTHALGETDANDGVSANVCNRVSEIEKQLILQASFLQEASLVTENLAERLRLIQEKLDFLAEERIAILGRLDMLRQDALTDMTTLALSCESDLGPVPPAGIAVSTVTEDALASFRLAVYIHIPKCSGSSLQNPYFNFAKERVKWVGMNASLDDIQLGPPRRCGHSSAIYCGHFFLWDIESNMENFDGCDIRYFAHLRNPLERAISYYKFIARTEDHPQHHLVTEFYDDLRSWFGDTLLAQSQVQYVFPGIAPSASAGSDHGDQSEGHAAKLAAWPRWALGADCRPGKWRLSA
jgi:hypothetical protein